MKLDFQSNLYRLLEVFKLGRPEPGKERKLQRKRSRGLLGLPCVPSVKIERRQNAASSNHHVLGGYLDPIQPFVKSFFIALDSSADGSY